MKLTKLKRKFLEACAHHDREAEMALHTRILRKILQRKKNGKKFTAKHVLK